MLIAAQKAAMSQLGTIALARNFIVAGRSEAIAKLRDQQLRGVMTLDRIDRQILALLQEDGRMTNVDLAERVGLTAPPCLRRVRALEQAGVIRGYHAECDPSQLGFPITVFAMVSLRSQAEQDLAAFENHVAAIPEVRECHMLNGEIDFILKIVAADLESFQRILTTKLTSAPNVASVKSSLTIRSSKSQVGVPIA
jgi:DNA-binding Lrp family transcriptional regulator